MIRRNLGKQPSHHGSQGTRKDLDQPGKFREPHHSQPKGEPARQRQGDAHHRVLRAERGGFRDRAQMAGEPANEYGEKDEPEPDGVKHGGSIAKPRPFAKKEFSPNASQRL